MKPLKLVIQGIRSFSERAEIDFESVSKNGLFGIFGSTGSGKSTILDSVIIALYGEISGQKMSELISARCKSAYVALNFELSNKGIRKSYLVERTFKLKKDGSYGSAVAFLYETTSGLSVALASQTSEVNRIIEDILGLGQNEFTKCIILPQGEFSQFVKASKGDRVKIIEKLFSLERYGEIFSIRLKAKLNELDVQIKVKEENLKLYESVTEDILKNQLNLQNETQKSLDLENVKLYKINEFIRENEYYYNLSKQLDEDKKKLYDLQSKADEISKKRQIATLNETAKKICEENEILVKLQSDFSSLSDRLNKLIKNNYEIDERVKKSQEQYALRESLIKQKDECLNKKEALLGANGDFKRHGELKRVIQSLTAQIELANEKLLQSYKVIEKCNQLEAETLEKLKKIEDDNRISDLFSSVSSSALSNEYSEQVLYYKDQIKKIEDYNDESELYGYVISRCNERLNEYGSRLSNINSCDTLSLDDAIENYKSSMQIKRQIEADLKVVSIDKARAEELCKNLVQSISSYKTDLENANNEYSSLNIKLLKIVDNIDSFESNLIYISDMYKSLVQKEEALQKEYISAKEAQTEIKIKLNEMQSEADSKSVALKGQNELVESLFTDGVSSVERAKEIYAEGIDLALLTDEIEQYEKDTEFYQKSVQRLENELGKVDFDVNRYREKIGEREQILQNCENFKEKLINYQNNNEKLSQNFDKRCIIEKDLISLRAREGVFRRLEQAVSRRAFAEFISAEFLSDVARSARKTLLELTGGKYDVVYHDSLDGAKDGFYVVDNLNGGTERSVSSLSGGETFLVSLSLALSLSAGIYAGSDRPMEFFFLDEGFGTLDEDLVDTVLDSLEKLRNKSFSIGLISHLSEMKSRIQSKITVMPADETHGSRVLHTGIN